MDNKVVDLRKERVRRDEERRRALLEALSDGESEEEDNDGEQKEEERMEEKPSEEKRDGLFWDALEYEYHDKQQDVWVKMTLIVAIPIAILFLFMKNVLGLFVIVFGVASFLLAAFKKPKIVTYGIEEKGVSVDGVVHPYEKLESFWIFPKEKGNMLSLIRKGLTGKHISATPLGATKKERIQNLERVSGEDNAPHSSRKSFFSQHLKFPLGDVDIDTLRKSLKPHVKEVEDKLSATDAWLRRIGY